MSDAPIKVTKLEHEILEAIREDYSFEGPEDFDLQCSVYDSNIIDNNTINAIEEAIASLVKKGLLTDTQSGHPIFHMRFPATIITKA